MRHPSPADEKLLHERVLRQDPVVSTEVFQTYVEPIIEFLTKRLGRDEDEANQCAVDAIFSYLKRPDRYAPDRGRLLSYLMRSAKNRALDKRSSADARSRREKEYGIGVEQGATPPKEALENSVEAKRVMELLEKRQVLTREQDRNALKLILMGEGSTERLAEALELGPLPRDELKKAVKRHRDRLMKVLERFGQLLERGGKEDSDDES